ncbi:osmoprotectant transport system substrate-binding protein [Labedella gwakjiensis]|uniref:ABC transporter substrate-binding protein n=1 Tax=Labedella gwakjiensis TaxID=390269 RepID=A0A2P8GX32_9MICO|nr:ABC transporter substrate-binding protein [Labedella gwakjiensis]PSL38528.1 osmoprotectant transport system substrate-binding protein [Labedella gwakjiensis]RUQ86960.1 ABC transporter substrate-binding protein [Labedella gwakjiensis]
MFTKRRHGVALGLLAAGAVLTLAACSNGDPITGSGGGSDDGGSGDSQTIAIGSAGFAESEIIAEIYAQALEANGYTVERTMQIGQRDAYIAALDDGSIDLVPDYTGNLLQFYDAGNEAVTSDEVYSALGDVLPDGYEVLDQAPAEDKDSYNVTKDFADQYGLESLADLIKVDGPLVIGGNPELAERPYGPTGLQEIYGVSPDNIQFEPISDSGGPLTVQALLDGTVDIANIYSTTPAIADNGFVTLEDPENMILPQNVVPLINSDSATDEVAEILNTVSAELTTEDLIELNGRNQGDEKAAPATLATDWLADKGLFQ